MKNAFFMHPKMEWAWERGRNFVVAYSGTKVNFQPLDIMVMQYAQQKGIVPLTKIPAPLLLVN